MAADCWSLLKAAPRRVAKAAWHHRHPVRHAAHARGTPTASPSPAPSPGCRDTDAPYHALHSPAPGGAPGGGLSNLAARGAGLLAASSAVGAGVGQGWRTLAGAPATAGQAPGATLSQPVLGAPISTADLVAPSLTVPSVAVPVQRPDGAAPVAEPPSALILGAALFAAALLRCAALRHRLTAAP